MTNLSTYQAESIDEGNGQRPLLSVIAKDVGDEYHTKNLETLNQYDLEPANFVSAMAVSPELWVTPELRERNPEVFASYSPEKERHCMRQAALRIQENKMQTLRNAFTSCKRLSKVPPSASAPMSSSTQSVPSTESVATSSSYSNSFADGYDCLQSSPPVGVEQKDTITRISDLLDEKVFTGKQAIMAIVASILLPLVVIGMIILLGFGGLVLAILVGWAIYGMVRCYQDALLSTEQPQATIPLHLQQYGLMDSTKLQSIVHSHESHSDSYSDDPERVWVWFVWNPVI